jgi:quercetin 2,3-dioxygenase
VFPNKRNVKPRYDQITLKNSDRHNTFQQILSPNPNDAGVWIHQDAWFHLGRFEKGITTGYTIKKHGNGVYAFVIAGDVNIDGTSLHERDGLGIWETERISFTADSEGAEVLLMEVPMQE